MEGTKLIVIAIGGNSLIEDPKNVTVYAQEEAARKTCSHIVKLIKAGHKVVIVHGNGPQVGYILRRAEIAKEVLHTVPLDSCVADTQGAIGYNLQMGMYNEFAKLGMKSPVATVVTQVVVDKNDPSFSRPTKPIGSFMNEADALEQRDKAGWSIMEDAGRGFRRVVPSPRPQRIIEEDSIKAMIKDGVTVIAAGGGGIPVTEEDGLLMPQEAVIDKDFAAALLAKSIGADMLVISTAVEKVYTNFGKADQRALNEVNIEELKELVTEGHFAPGSMLPKIQAIIDFVEITGNRGLITDPAHLSEGLDGKTGTHIVRE
ncbi:MAG: carbamate kinase [Spirochaetales bacterium]|nr:carbamate kinase [Spirochaetales bacterium]